MKKWYLSKTLWANAVAAVVTVLAMAGVGVDTETQAEVLSAIVVVVNLVLRFVTKEAISK